jgi:DNA-binding NtrC family response regulator
MAERSSEHRWQAYLRHAREPLFLLNRRRRLLFANQAWEACTGISLAAVRGRSCRPARERPTELDESVLAALAPPPEALAGQTCRARRRAPTGGWWQLDFFPIAGDEGLLGILGKISPLTTPVVLPALPERLSVLRDHHAETFRLDSLASEVPAMRRVIEQARLASQSRLALSIVGGPGTGKHWLARAIHQASPVRDRCFARLDARALPPTLLAEFLLGSHGRRLALGTVYVSEPAELPRDLQDRLAQWLRAGDASTDQPRIIVGHRAEPLESMRAGRLLEELHFASSTLAIHLPPLAERRADLDGLIRLLCARAALLAGHPPREVSPEAAQALHAYAWPGNLRELADVLRDAGMRARGERIELADLPFFLRSDPLPAEKPLPLDQLLEQVERRLIERALRQARGNRTQAAEILGIWRPRLIRRLEHLGIAGQSEKENEDRA